jgi:hypothetical protein
MLQPSSVLLLAPSSSTTALVLLSLFHFRISIPLPIFYHRQQQTLCNHRRLFVLLLRRFVRSLFVSLFRRVGSSDGLLLLH